MARPKPVAVVPLDQNVVGRYLPRYWIDIDDDGRFGIVVTRGERITQEIVEDQLRRASLPKEFFIDVYIGE